MHSKRGTGALAAIAVLLLTSALPAGAGKEGGTPDLSVQALSVMGSADGIKIEVEVANVGTAASDQSALVLRDEYDLRDGSAVPISRLTIPSLDPGRSVVREVDWYGVTDPTHRIWAIVDGGAFDEPVLWNNVRSSLVELPSIESLGSPIDGDPSPTRIGTAFSGVTAPFPIEIGYSHLTDPSFVSAYVSVPGGESVYTPTGGDGVSRTSLDLGAHGPGEHNISAKVKVSGRGFGGNVSSFVCREVPVWISELASYQAEFDPVEGRYVFRGHLDLPTYSRTVIVEGIGREVPLAICGGASEVQFTITVMTDMTTTIEYSANIRFTIGTSSETVRMSGKAYAPDPESVFQVAAVSASEAEFDIGGPVGLESLYVDNGIGGKAPLVEQPPLIGNVSASLDIGLASGRLVPTLLTRIDLEGSGERIISGGAAGVDSAVTTIGENVTWSTVQELSEDGKWSGSGDVNGSLTVAATDLGVAEKDGARGIHGLSIVEGGGGSLSYVAIPHEEGSTKSVKLFSEGEEVTVHGSAIYMSDPAGAILSDGRAVVAWTESYAYTSSWKERYSSLRVRCAVQNGSTGGFLPETAFGGSTTRAPSLIPVGDGGSAALLYLADADGNASTGGDRRLTMSLYDGYGWSGPWRIGERPAESYAACQDGSGGLLTASVSIGGLELSMTDAPPQDGGMTAWTSVNGSVMSLAIGRSASGRPYLAYSAADPAIRGTFLAVREVGNDLSLGDGFVMGTSDGTIGSLGMAADPGGTLTLAWTESMFGDDRIVATSMTAEHGIDEWLEPLAARTDPGTKLSFCFEPLGGGSFAFGWLEGPWGDAQAGDAEGMPKFGTWNMSNACDIVAARHTLLDEYTPGQTFVVYADVEDRGLGPASSVQVDLIKVVRDPSTGNVTTNVASSRTIEIDRPAQLEFPVTVSENQLGLYVVCEGPKWSGPDHPSSYFLSIPAVSDPVFEGVEYTMDAEGNVNARARVENRGAMPTGVRGLRLMGSTPTLPMAFPGRIWEPAHLRTVEGGSVINATDIYLGPYESKVVDIRANAMPGVRTIWLEIERRSWEGSGTSEAYVARSLPSIEAASDGSEFVPGGSDANASLTIRNSGTSAIDDMPLEGIRGSGPIAPIAPVGEVTLELLSANGSVIYSSSFDVSGLSPGGSMTIDPSGSVDWPGAGPDVEGISCSWQREYVMMSGHTGAAKVRRVAHLPPSPEVALTQPELVAGKSLRSLTLSASNGHDRSVPSMVLVLYDGLPVDGVVVSSVLVPEVPPLSNVSLSLPVELREGRYLLCVVSYVASDAGQDGTVAWRESGRRSGEFTVQNITEGNGDDDGKGTEKELERAMIIAFGLGAVIVVGAMANRAFEESKRKK